MTVAEFEAARDAVDPALADAWLLFVRLVEGGAFADLGVVALFPRPVHRRDEPTARLRERAVELTGSTEALVDEVLRRLWGWPVSW